MPATPETILAFDFGKRRIGVAVGQQVTSSASPLAVVTNGPGGPEWASIETLVGDWQPSRLIVGMPTNADGSPAEIGESVAAFIDQLGRYSLCIETVDERYSSLEAEELLRSRRKSGQKGRINKEMIDAAAAVLIAERWLKKEN